jgi:hypothetical protein
MSFLGRAFTISSIADRVVALAPRPGNRGFITERQQSQLAQLIGQVLGYPIQLRIEQKQAAAAEGGDGQGAGPDSGLTQRQLAMKLPLVQQINDLFDVSLVEVSEDEAVVLPVPQDDEMDDDLLDLEEQDDV